MAKTLKELEQEEALREEYRNNMDVLKDVVNQVNSIKSTVHNNIIATWNTAKELGDDELLMEVYATSNQIAFDKPTDGMRKEFLGMYDSGHHEHGEYTLVINESTRESVSLKEIEENDPMLYATLQDYIRVTKSKTVSVRGGRK